MCSNLLILFDFITIWASKGLWKPQESLFDLRIDYACCPQVPESYQTLHFWRQYGLKFCFFRISCKLNLFYLQQQVSNQWRLDRFLRVFLICHGFYESKSFCTWAPSICSFFSVRINLWSWCLCRAVNNVVKWSVTKILYLHHPLNSTWLQLL